MTLYPQHCDRWRLKSSRVTRSPSGLEDPEATPRPEERATVTEEDTTAPASGALITPGSHSIYDPLRRENLGRSVLWALMSSKPAPLDQIPPFRGCGIYAIYYTGDNELYASISSVDFEVPIYVGKADPEGARKGQNVVPAWEGTRLRDRLRKHAKTIKAVPSLNIEDFYARYLPADDLFTPMAERLMISELQPVWNIVLDGFGANNPGGRRDQGLRPKWHQVHPGVAWAKDMPDQPSGTAKLEAEVVAHLERHHTVPTPVEGQPGSPASTDIPSV